MMPSGQRAHVLVRVLERGLHHLQRFGRLPCRRECSPPRSALPRRDRAAAGERPGISSSARSPSASTTARRTSGSGIVHRLQQHAQRFRPFLAGQHEHRADALVRILVVLQRFARFGELFRIVVAVVGRELALGVLAAASRPSSTASALHAAPPRASPRPPGAPRSRRAVGRAGPAPASCRSRHHRHWHRTHPARVRRAGARPGRDADLGAGGRRVVAAAHEQGDPEQDGDGGADHCERHPAHRHLPVARVADNCRTVGLPQKRGPTRGRAVRCIHPPAKSEFTVAVKACFWVGKPTRGAAPRVIP